EVFSGFVYWPSFRKSFSPGVIVVGQTTDLGFFLANDNQFDLHGVGFTDNLPDGLVIDQSAVETRTCHGSITAIPGSSVITLSDGRRFDGYNSCEFPVRVKATTTGRRDNVTSRVTSNETGDGQRASSSLEVQPPVLPPAIVEFFNPATIRVGQ